MVDGTNIQTDFQSVIDDIGQPIIVSYFTQTYYGDDYDDAPATFVASGTVVYTSGVVQPVKFGQSPNNAQTNTLLEQGLIKMSDKIVYLPSGTDLNEQGDLKIQIGIGSPARDTFSILPNAVSVPTEVDGIFVYQKAYIRRLTPVEKPDTVPLFFTVKTDETGTSNDDQFTVPAVGGPYSITWEDGSSDTGKTGNFTKTFAGGAGTYFGLLTSDDATPFQPFQFFGGGDRQKITLITQWGTSVLWSSITQAFRSCTLLKITAADGPDLSNAVSATAAFRSATGLTELDLTNWDFSTITAASEFLRSATSLTTLNGMTNKDFSGINSLGSFASDISISTLDVTGTNITGTTSLTSMFSNITELTDITGLELLDYSTITNMANFLLGVTLSTSRYSDFLINLEAGSHKPNVTLGGGNSKYSAGAAATARAALVSDGWTITDGGQE